MDQINLHLNENPYAIPDFMISHIISTLRSSHRYPIGYEEKVALLVAEHFGVRPSNVLLTHGIDECIDRLVNHFCSMRFVYAKPGFDAYWRRAGMVTDNTLALPIDTAGFVLNENAISKINHNDFVMLASPANPTGNLINKEQVDRIRMQCGYLLLDRTYRHYASDRGLRESLDKQFTYHSFSKAYGLAGFRLGVVIGPEEEIESIRRSSWFCAMSAPGLAAIESALTNEWYFNDRADEVALERNRVYAELRSIGYDVSNSEANFLLLNTRGRPIRELLSNAGILVRDVSSLGLPGHLRISIARARQNDQLIAAMAEIFDVAERELHAVEA